MGRTLHERIRQPRTHESSENPVRISRSVLLPKQYWESQSQPGPREAGLHHLDYGGGGSCDVLIRESTSSKTGSKS